VLAKITGLLAGAGISIDAVLQREADEVGGQLDPDRPDHPHARHARRGYGQGPGRNPGLPTVLAPITRIRKEELN
jgi:homoserine dehydrogenase